MDKTYEDNFIHTTGTEIIIKDFKKILRNIFERLIQSSIQSSTFIKILFRSTKYFNFFFLSFENLTELKKNNLYFKI